MRGLSDGEKLADLIEGNIQPLAKLGDVVRHEDSMRGIGQRNAGVTGAEGLPGQGRERARDLGGEHHRRQARHHFLGLTQHGRHALGQGVDSAQAALIELLRKSRGEGTRDIECDRLADPLPHGDRVLNPGDPGPHVARHRTRGKLRDRVKPQIGHAHRLAGSLGLGCGWCWIPARVSRLLGAILHDTPVDGARGGVHEELELAESRSHAFGIGELGWQLRRVEALSLKGSGCLGGGLVAQDRAQEILKRGAGVVLVHVIRLAAARALGLTKACENAES